jgi:hypothetical protein
MNAPQLAEQPSAPMQELESKVRRRLGSRIRDLRIVVRADGVILQGWALNYHAKQLAQHAAMELALAPILSNDIEVKPVDRVKPELSIVA